jgi:Fe-S cluster assembly iron-binding protein IscA
MLQITQDAAMLIRQAREERGISDHAILRIDRGSGNHDTTAFRLGFVDEVPAGDQVGESAGVSVCIAGPLAEELDDKVLDVQQTGGEAGLVLRAA